MEERLKFLFIGSFFPIIFGAIRFSVNQGNFHQNEVIFIVICVILLVSMIYYVNKKELIAFRWLTKKEWLLLIIILLLQIVFVYIYASLFQVSSGSSTSFTEDRLSGYTVSFVLAISFFSPIEEELVMRGFILKGVFQNSYLGLILTSCLFAVMHEPNNIIAFVFYMITGVIYGTSYRLSDNLLIPILAHISYNSFVLGISLL